jgi:hypothetical protein
MSPSLQDCFTRFRNVSPSLGVSIPSFQSEKGSQEMKQSQHQNQFLDQVDDSAELELSSSEEGETDLKDDSSSEGGGIYLAEDRFDFYREFEMKVDMLEGHCVFLIVICFDVTRYIFSFGFYLGHCVFLIIIRKQ